MKETLLLLIIILLFIDYFHKQYRIKRSIKNIKYRNSNSYYDDTDYSKYKPYKEVYTYKILIIFLIILLIIDIFSPNNTNLREKIISGNLIKKAIYTDNATDQFQVGTYHNKFTEKIYNIFLINIDMITPEALQYYTATQYNEQLNNINSLIYEINNYKPKDIETKLHKLDIKKLYLLKDKFEIAIKLKTNSYDYTLANSLNSKSNELNITNNEFRIELLRIFNEINMKYEIKEDGTIEFTYEKLY